MNILMMTNTYLPHVGGVARSVASFTNEYRQRGHRVMVVAPEFEHMPEDEMDVIRLSAIQRFNGSDFSVVLPLPRFLSDAIEQFKPDIVHSHHPFLVGSTALRVAHVYELPLVFTHHTMYEQSTHYVPGDSAAMRRFAIELATRYANICTHVFAPSESIAAVLTARGVQAPISVVPTGVHLDRFAQGSGAGFRQIMGIPAEAFVVGHIGRLAPEKNLIFLAEALSAFLNGDSNAHAIVAGVGSAVDKIREIFARHGVAGRLHLTGILEPPFLASAYRAMDLFAFASKSETQGLVLAEAMAAGVPVVALDAPGVREVVVDGHNGRLLYTEDIDDYVAALRWLQSHNQDQRLRHAVKQTAERFSIEHSADTALTHYAQLLERTFVQRHEQYDAWQGVLRLLESEWRVLESVSKAARAALHK